MAERYRGDYLIKTTNSLIIGAGPAGLTAAYELCRTPDVSRPLVVEAGQRVGGIARTEERKGYRFDIGGHRFFTKVTEIEVLWHEVMGDDFIQVPRKSRIYYQGKFYNYPLDAFNALQNLGLAETLRVLISYMVARMRPRGSEENLEEWVTLRFGARLYHHFFKTYTEKVWGIPCTEIRADWAAQRIKDLSLLKAVRQAITGKTSASSLIQSFYYPRLGPGQMWEKFAQHVEDQGGEVRLEHAVIKLVREKNRITHADLLDTDGNVERIPVDHVINSMPLGTLIHSIDPPPPPGVLDAADQLKHRDFLIVTLVLDQADPFDDNWLYIHNPGVKVGRIQNFRAWSKEMVPEPNRSSLGMEYFCTVGDGLWESSDAELTQLATEELDSLGLADRAKVVDSFVIRQPAAYPLYDEKYRQHVHTIRTWLDSVENLQTVGRNGMHRYNNQDHSMLTGLLAARNLAGEVHDLWSVNVERSYLEDFELRRTDQSTVMSPVKQTVGVVVPVYNNRLSLERCLRSILAQHRHADEVLVVDDGSTDGSGALAEALGIQVIRTGDLPLGPATARNRAADVLKTDVLLFVDSDVELHTSTLANLIAPLERDQGPVATFGSYDDTPDCRNIAALYANLRHHHVHQSSAREASTFWAGCGAIRRAIFQEVGGFDESFTRPSIEDIELGMRIKAQGARIQSVPGAQARHLKEWSVWRLWKVDLFDRAIPWARCLMKKGEDLNDLNTSRQERFLAVCAHLVWVFAVVAYVFHPLWLAVSLVAAGICLAMNRRLMSLLLKRGGVSACIGGGFLHLLYYIYASAAYAWVWGQTQLTKMTTLLTGKAG